MTASAAQDLWSAPLGGSPLSEEDAVELASLLKVLADPARLRVLSEIATRPSGEACGCELVERLGRSQPTISHHLKVLYEAGLLTREQRGTWAWYRIVPSKIERVLPASDAVREAIGLTPPTGRTRSKAGRSRARRTR